MPDIVIAGATFRNVPQIDIPKEGSGTASFVYEDGTKQITQNGTGIDVSGYAAVDVAVPSTAPVIQSLSVTQNGTYTAPSGVDGYSPITVNVSGGGGASNVVQGEFTAPTAGTALEVTVPYTGEGYPIFIHIGVKDGFRGNSTFNNTLQRYAIGEYCMVKTYTDYAPYYNTGSSGVSNDQSASTAIYKSSATKATSYTASGDTGFYGYTPSSYPAEAGISECCKFHSNKKFTIFSADPSASIKYGFLAGTVYEYTIIYSS